MTPAIAVYVYRAASGEPLRRKLRFPGKHFAWETYAAGTWTSGACDATATLYDLDLLAAQRPETVFVTEGEKDSDNVVGLGLVDLDRLLWYCHGCQVGGGPVAFYLKWEAVRHGRMISRKAAWHRLKATYL